jgi:RNA polymerase sigma factor (sigma-70 family)
MAKVKNKLSIENLDEDIKKKKNKKTTEDEDFVDDSLYDDDDEDDIEINDDIINEDEIEEFGDEINEEELLIAQGLDEEFETEYLEAVEEIEVDEKVDYKRVYKASSKSEIIREKFVGICEKYNSSDPELKKDAINDAIEELKSFVHYVIKKKYSTYGKHYEDLVQEGYIGIIKGMEKYNPDKSLPTTFFNLYIIHEMSKFIDTEVNKTTSHYSSNLTKINRVIDKIEASGKPWNANDIAIETGLNMETVIQCLNIKEYKNEMYYETDDILESNISERSPSPEQKYIENERLDTLYKSISGLLLEERLVLMYRYGLAGAKTISYKEIAKEMGVSIEKVRKYRHDAIRKLRHKANMKNTFRDYINESENNSITENDVSLIPEQIATNMMKELEEIEFDFDFNDGE